MKELYLVMRELLELEYNQKSLGYILEVLGRGYEDERQGEAMIVNSAKYYLSKLQTELREVIDRLDTYMAEGKDGRKEKKEESPGKESSGRRIF